MGQRWGLFVDAGWLFAAGSRFAFGEGVPRAGLEWDPGELVGALVDVARELVPRDAELLRTYWYDGSPNRLPIGVQIDVARLPDVKVRLGRSSPHGQKGVDGLIIHDLITHAYRQTLSDAVLITGDEDLLDAIESAQANGTRVHLLEIPVGGIAEAIYRAVDRIGTLNKELWEANLRAPGLVPQNQGPTTSEAVVEPPAPLPTIAPEAARGAAARGRPDQLSPPARKPDQLPPPTRRPDQLPPPARRPEWMTRPGSRSSDRSVEVLARHDEISEAAAMFARRWLEENSDDDYLELMASRPYLANGLDAELLRFTSDGEWLTDGQRRTMRDVFWRTLEAWATVV